MMSDYGRTGRRSFHIVKRVAMVYVKRVGACLSGYWPAPSDHPQAHHDFVRGMDDD
jgi:hypothetical protein